MLAEGGMFGLVENVRGEFREEDRLMLNGTAYHERAPEGSLVVTSGLAGLMPRGIPVGRIQATAEVQGSWRKSYWLEPLVDPAAVTHVLVETASEAGEDLSRLWAADDSVAAEPGHGDGRG
jgi:cell shape-determining protein MreC